MFDRIPRWNMLMLLAICNLLLWIAVAIGVGVLATDTVDLGVESFIRTQQATVVAVWNRVAIGPATASATAPAVPTAVISVSRPTRTTAPTGQPLAATVMLAQAPQAPAPIPPTERPEPTAGPAVPTSRPTVEDLTSPLLVSDPDMASIGRIDAEMSRSATGRPVQIRYDEATLNREVTALLSSYPDLPYQNLQVDLKRDQVILTGDVTVMGFQVNAEVQGTVVVRDCLPQAKIAKISIAGVVTPGFIKDNIGKIVAESLSWYPRDYPLCLEQIVVEEDRVTIYGSRR